MGLPIRRHSFKASEFAAYLAANGAEIGLPTNVYEVIRYKLIDTKGRAKTHIVYAKESGLLTYTGDTAEHYQAFRDGAVPEIAEQKVKRVGRIHNKSSVREKLIKRDGECCWYCGSLLSSAESNIEHLISVSDGGTNAMANLVLTHTACNNRAGNMPLSKKMELRMKLRSRQEA